MVSRMLHPRRRHSRTVRRRAVPICEALEQRTVLNGSRITAGMGAAVLDHGPRYDYTVESRPDDQPSIGTITGTITNAANGEGIPDIPVELIASAGHVRETTRTNALGQYGFEIAAKGPYVVREVPPTEFVQTSPTFVYTKPRLSGKNLPFQSPINISAPPINLSKYLTISYNDIDNGEVINTGKDIKVEVPSSNSETIDVGGQEFTLAALHYHDPSENHVRGKGYTMEEHFVNKSTSGAVTVLSVFLKMGAYNPALQPILDAASALPSRGTATTPSTPIHFAGLLPSSMRGWFFQGSFTTSPYEQPANWFVFATPITLDCAQLRQYERVAKASGFLPNARRIQPLDGRQVNEFNYNVNFQSQSVAGLNFTLAATSQSLGG